jgi:sorbitol/mannitol transport system permease protein
VLLIWMIVPLAMTLWFSFQSYNLLYPDRTGFAGWDNYFYFVTDFRFGAAIRNTLVLVGSVLAITTIGGVLLALLLDQPFRGQGIVRLLVLAPFFVMPTVSALVWKNMFMNPVNGLFGHIAQAFGAEAGFDFLGQAPLFSIIIMVSWQWLPFATLILLTALQSLDSEQIEAAEMDGAGAWSRFVHIVLPHLTRAITVVVLIQTIFLLSVYAEILVTTNGGPGTASLNLPFLVYLASLVDNDVGMGAAGGVIAIILANSVAFFLRRAIGKNLET